MKRADLVKVIADCCNDVIFEYNGKKSGVTAEVMDSVPTFQAWHGDKTREYDNIDDLMNDSFYSGKSISELLETVEFTFA